MKSSLNPASGFAEHLQAVIDAGELFVVYVEGGPAGLRVVPVDDAPMLGTDDLTFTQAVGTYVIPFASISYVVVLA